MHKTNVVYLEYWVAFIPPAADILSCLIGEKIGKEAYNYGVQYFNGTLGVEEAKNTNTALLYPNPIKNQIKHTFS